MRERMRTTLVCAVVLAVGLAATAEASHLITGSQIKNGSIGLVDLSKSARHALAGKTGPMGPAGPAGAQGPAGAPGVNAITDVMSPRVTIPSGQSSYDVEQAGGPSLEADCPAGQAVVGTGFDDSVGSVGFVLSFGNLVGGFMYNDSSISIDVTVEAMCAPGSASGISAASQGEGDSSFQRAAASAQAQFKHS